MSDGVVGSNSGSGEVARHSHSRQSPIADSGIDGVNGNQGELPPISSFAGSILPDDDTCWRALGAHDARFDGLFYVGVKSTGIYCRGVCPAKMPKRENCTFYRTAAEAEAAGFRPCLKCRPELAPGIPIAPDTDCAAQRAALLIREHAGSCSIADVASQVGLSERQLRRLFEREFGIAPTAYRATCRLLLAKGLLTDTDLPITRVAYACGFSSIRRFNDAFSQTYRMPPSRFRAKVTTGVSQAHPEPIMLQIGYRTPFRFDLILTFLALRAIEGVEVIRDGTYMRTVRIDDVPTGRVGWIRVADDPERSRLALTVSPELFDDLPYVVARTRRLFDVDCVPMVVEEALGDFHLRTSEANHTPGIRVPCSFDGFEMAVRAILGQQITVKAASTLAGRVARAFGSPIDTPFSGLDTAFPPPNAFCGSDAEDRLGELGVIRQRSHAICVLAREVVSGKIGLCPGSDLGADVQALHDIPGIGDWTVQYLLMRAYAHPDAFPAGDLAVREAFPGMKPKDIIALSEQWAPWRSYAVMSLWSVFPKPQPSPPAEAKPTKSRQAQPKPQPSPPAEAKPTKSRQAQPKPTKSQPAEPKPTKSRQAQPKPTKSQPAEAKPTKS